MALTSSAFFAGLCHNGAWKLPSGKWLCMVNVDITKAHPEAQKYCEVIGFDWLYEPRTLEDSQLTVRLEFCKCKKIQTVCYLRRGYVYS